MSDHRIETGVDGRVPAEPGSQGSAPQPPAASSPVGADPSRKMLFSRKEVAGTLAMWAVRQSPYVIPENLAVAIASMHDALPDEHGDWFFATEDQLRQVVEFICLNDQTIVAWNTPHSGHAAEIVFSSRYDGPAPDDDFIDLHALANNVCRSLIADQDDYTASAMGAREGQDPQGLEAKPASATAESRDAQPLSTPSNGEPA